MLCVHDEMSSINLYINKILGSVHVLLLGASQKTLLERWRLYNFRQQSLGIHPPLSKDQQNLTIGKVMVPPTSFLKPLYMCSMALFEPF